MSRIIALLMFIIPVSVSAECPCPDKVSTKSAIGDSSVVFVGRIGEQYGYSLTPKLPFVQSEVAIVKTYKLPSSLHSLGKQVMIYTPIGEARCGIPLKKGDEYIIFATGHPDFLQTNNCSRTILRKDKDAKKTEKYLSRWKKHNRWH